MFLGKDIAFQIEHEENLLKKFASNGDIVLQAPTGSGKTVLASRFIDDYLEENPKTVFLWLCPGAGSLEKQSQATFRNVTEGINDGDVYDFLNEPNPAGKVFFINWDKINKKSAVVLREGEQKDLITKLQCCHDNGIDIFMIIDEDQRFSKAANEYVLIIRPKKILRISATPINKGDTMEVISDDEVISAGLISKGISINEEVNQEIENEDDDLRLLALADAKRKEIQQKYDELGVNVRPLVLIQFPNGQPEWIERVEQALDKMGYSRNSGLVTAWFSGDHPDDVEEIKKLNGQYSFLLFKQAIATGWDCPRAKILIKLREGGTEAFNIQTIGRIRRMPEHRHYDIDLLDNCYLYTLDNKFTQGMTHDLTESFYSYQYKKKSTAPNIQLEKEYLKDGDRFAVNPEAVVKVIRKVMLKACDLNGNGKLNKKEMETAKGYIFDTKLKTFALQGIVRTAAQILTLNPTLSGEHEINTHNDGFIIRDAKRRIASAIGIDENISNNALRILFGPENMQMSLSSKEERDFEHENKLIPGMSLREYNAFLVNNRDRLIDVFKNVNANEIGEIQESEPTKTIWGIPAYQYYKQHKKLKKGKVLNKNVFVDYSDNILIDPNRSHTEVEFERWCEDYDNVKSIYKNGDKGDDFFSLIYRVAFKRNNFYPDYIIETANGDIWIIEAKGGLKPDGTSNNIDSLAKNKFEALKKYCEKHPKIKWGFVRVIGTQLYMSNTIWEENPMNRNVWKPIEVFI